MIRCKTSPSKEGYISGVIARSNQDTSASFWLYFWPHVESSLKTMLLLKTIKGLPPLYLQDSLITTRKLSQAHYHAISVTDLLISNASKTALRQRMRTNKHFFSVFVPRFAFSMRRPSGDLCSQQPLENTLDNIFK